MLRSCRSRTTIGFFSAAVCAHEAYTPRVMATAIRIVKTTMRVMASHSDVDDLVDHETPHELHDPREPQRNLPALGLEHRPEVVRGHEVREQAHADRKQHQHDRRELPLRGERLDV